MRGALLALLAATLVAFGLLYALAAHRAPNDPRLHTGDSAVVLLSAKWCGYCKLLKADLDRANASYQVLDVDTTAGAQAARAIGLRGVPVTVVGQQLIHGYQPERVLRAIAQSSAQSP